MEIDIKLKFDETGIDATFTTDEEEGVAIGDEICSDDRQSHQL